jgi:hypothetical protein
VNSEAAADADWPTRDWVVADIRDWPVVDVVSAWDGEDLAG